MPIHSVEVEGDMQFIGSTSDECIIPWMKENKKTWAGEDIEEFLHVAPKIRNSVGGIFLDIGANIGTTSVYIAKSMGMNVIAFEPDINNYKILRSNCILNGVEQRVRCENVALSNKAGKQRFNYDEKNPGGSSLVDDNSDLEGLQEVSVLRLDDYIRNVNMLYSHFMDMDLKYRKTGEWQLIENIEKYIHAMDDENRAQTDFVLAKRV